MVNFTNPHLYNSNLKFSRQHQIRNVDNLNMTGQIKWSIVLNSLLTRQTSVRWRGIYSLISFPFPLFFFISLVVSIPTLHPNHIHPSHPFTRLSTYLTLRIIVDTQCLASSVHLFLSPPLLRGFLDLVITSVFLRRLVET
jgi:hypothetical protein